MKRIFTFSILLISSLCNAQNWIPVSTGEVYHYKFEEKIYSIKIDSSNISLTDQIYYLNKVAQTCDTCDGSIEYSLYSDYPQFLMREMKSNSAEPGVYYFHDTAEYCINTNAMPGESWVFQESQDIIAEVTNTYTTAILNYFDSVKTIQLSNGRTIEISKNHGIIQFPDFQSNQNYILEGMKGNIYGFQFPDFSEVYNFNIGDVFQYESFYYLSSDQYVQDIKWTILNKESYDDSISYEILEQIRKMHYNWIGMPSGPYFTSENIVEKYYRSDEPMIDGYSGQFVDINIYSSGYNYERYGVLDFEFNEAGQVISYSLEAHNNQLLDFNVYEAFDDENPNLLSPIGKVEKTIIPGLGLTIRNIDILPAYSHYELIGYVKNGDTTGIVYNDSYYTPVEIEKRYHQTLDLYPNPSTDFIQFSFEGRSPVRFYKITNVAGQVVQHGKLKQNQNQKINVSKLNNGLYLFECFDDTGILATERFIIKR